MKVLRRFKKAVFASALEAQFDALVETLRGVHTQVGAGLGREFVLRQNLSRLTSELDLLHETARARFDALQSTEERCQQLAGQLEDMRQLVDLLRGDALRGQDHLAAMKQERDDIQLRLHAVDHAYAQMRAAEGRQVAFLLTENDRAMETIRCQRQFIRTLYTSRAKRKAKASAVAKGTPCSCLKPHPVSVSTEDGAVIACRKCFGVPK